MLSDRCRSRAMAPARNGSTTKAGKIYMLYTIALILIVLWLLGLVSSYTLGGVLHALLVVAIVIIIFKLITRGK